MISDSLVVRIGTEESEEVHSVNFEDFHACCLLSTYLTRQSGHLSGQLRDPAPTGNRGSRIPHTNSVLNIRLDDDARHAGANFGEYLPGFPSPDSVACK